MIEVLLGLVVAFLLGLVAGAGLMWHFVVHRVPKRVQKFHRATQSQTSYTKTLHWAQPRFHVLTEVYSGGWFEGPSSD